MTKPPPRPAIERRTPQGANVWLTGGSSGPVRSRPLPPVPRSVGRRPLADAMGLRIAFERALGDDPDRRDRSAATLRLRLTLERAMGYANREPLLRKDGAS